MLCHRCLRLFKPANLRPIASAGQSYLSPLRNAIQQQYVHDLFASSIRQAHSHRLPSSRAFSIFSSQRPSLLLPKLVAPMAPAFQSLAQTRTFASSAALGAPRNTTNRMTHLIRKRRNGFLARLKSKTGRRILNRRKAKGRKNLSH